MILNEEKLLQYGFHPEGERYRYQKEILDGQFLLVVEIARDEEIKTVLYDKLTEEPYTLHLLPEANGAFVGSVRKEYEDTLNEIRERCFDHRVFHSDFLKAVEEYAKATYGDEPEYLWEKLPEAAVLRRKDNRKWYAIFMKIPLKSSVWIRIKRGKSSICAATAGRLQTGRRSFRGTT